MTYKAPILRALLATALVFAGSAGVARAQEKQSLPKGFDLFAGTQKTKGNAHGYGSVTFTHNDHQLYLQGTINDLCDAKGKGDGYGAYLSVFAKFRGDTTGWWLVGSAIDRDRCGRPGNKFAFHTSITNRNKIKKVKVRVLEQDQDPKIEPYGYRNGDSAAKIFFP